MRLGNKDVRYAVVKKDGTMKLVNGATLNGTTKSYKKLNQFLRIKNRGSENTVTLYDNESNTEKGSFIVKNNNGSEIKVVNDKIDYGFIDQGSTGTEVTVPASSELYTHYQKAIPGQDWDTNNHYATVAYIPEGNFEVFRWNPNGMTSDGLRCAFENSKGITKVPNTWPDDCKDLSYALYNTNVSLLPSAWNCHPTDISFVAYGTPITKMPPWTELNNCESIFCAFEHCQNITDFTFDGIDNLTNIKKCGYCFNDVVIKQDLHEQDNQFYKLYEILKESTKNVTVDHWKNKVYGHQQLRYTINVDDTDYQVRPNCFYAIPNYWGGNLTECSNAFLKALSGEGTKCNDVGITFNDAMPTIDNYPNADVVDGNLTYRTSKPFSRYDMVIINYGPIDSERCEALYIPTSASDVRGKTVPWSLGTMSYTHYGDYQSHVYIYKQKPTYGSTPPTFSGDSTNGYKLTDIGDNDLICEYDFNWSVNEPSETTTE